MRARPGRGIQVARDIGRVVKATRTAMGWSQAKLAARVGTSQSSVSRVEAGDPTVALQTVFDLVDALGIRTDLELRPPYLEDRRHQTDPAHARACAYVARRLATDGWDVRLEVEIGEGRGWMDVLAFRPADRSLFLAEIKSEVHDVGAIHRTLSWYEREAWSAARRSGWSPRRLTSALLLLATEANDRRLLENSALFRQTCPTRANALRMWLSESRTESLPRAVAMIDPSSRRRTWLGATTADGRRTPAPYAHYAEFMSRVRRVRANR